MPLPETPPLSLRQVYAEISKTPVSLANSFTHVHIPFETKLGDWLGYPWLKAVIIGPVTNITDTSATFNWTDTNHAPYNETNTYVEVSTTPDFSSGVIYPQPAVVDETSYNMTGLIAGTTYYVRLRAFRGSQMSVSAPWSETVGFTTTQLAESETNLNTPILISITDITDTSGTINYNDNSAYESRIKIQISRNSSFTDLEVDTYNSADTTNHPFTAFTSNTTYWVRIRNEREVFGPKGQYDLYVSGWSNVLSFTTNPTDPNALVSYDLNAVGIVSDSATGCGASISWDGFKNKNKGVTGQQLQRANNSAMTENLITYNLHANTYSFTSHNFTCGLKYYYRARAVRNEEYGPWSNIDSAIMGDVNS